LGPKSDVAVVDVSFAGLDTGAFASSLLLAVLAAGYRPVACEHVL
jgi:hypothetical protein